MNVPIIVVALVASWAASVLAITAWAALRLSWAKRAAAPTSPPGETPSFAIVRPCAGREPHLGRALRSVAAARGPRAAEIVFAIESENDPAAVVAHQTAAWLETLGQRARVQFTAARGPNHKVEQLRVAFDSLGTDITIAIVVDSDVDLTDFDLSGLLSPFASDDVAAVWAPPVETSTTTAADRASRAVLSASLHAFPVLAQIDAGGMVGKVMALRRTSLARIGGFASLQRHLGEDMELARRFRAEGSRVRATTAVARSLATRPKLADTIERYARWLTVIRMQRPALLASYPLLLAPTAPMLFAAALIAPSEPGLAAPLAVLIITTRLAGVFLARAATGQPPAPWTALADAARADSVLLRAWTRALTRKTVRWRGGDLNFDREGLLVARSIGPR